MNVGDHVTTLPTTRPKYYANIRGEVVTRNGDEWGVEIKGRVVWFLEKEITECQTNANVRSTTSNGYPASGRAGGGARSTSPSLGPPRTTDVRRMPPGPLTIPSSPVPAVPRDSAQDGVSAPSRGSGGLLEGPCGHSRVSADGLVSSSCPVCVTGDLRPMEGSRGPSGGMYARCQGCGEMWERERRRGRPAARCGRCRG